MLSARTPWIACLLLFAVANLDGAPLPEKANLRYQFKEGQKLRYSLEEKGEMEFGIAGNQTRIETRTVFHLLWQVARVNKEGKVTVRQTLERIQMTLDLPTGKMSYDSQAGKEPDDATSKELARALKVFVGEEMTLTLDSRGQIESLKYSAKLAGEIARLPPQAASMAQVLSEDVLRRTIGQCLPAMPEKAPNKGQTWDSKLQAKMSSAVNFTLDNKYTLEGEVKRQGRTTVKIGNKPTITVTTNPGSAATIKVLKQQASSTSYFEPATGRLLESVYAQKLELEVSENGQTTTLKGGLQATLTRVEKEK